MKLGEVSEKERIYKVERTGGTETFVERNYKKNCKRIFENRRI